LTPPPPPPPPMKTLLPITEAFDEHVHRAHFQVAIWRSAL